MSFLYLYHRNSILTFCTYTIEVNFAILCFQYSVLISEMLKKIAMLYFQ